MRTLGLYWKHSGNLNL